METELREGIKKELTSMKFSCDMLLALSYQAENHDEEIFLLTARDDLTKVQENLSEYYRIQIKGCRSLQ